MSAIKTKFKSTGLELPSMFDYENLMAIRDWLRGKLSEEDCSMKLSDLMHPHPMVRNNAKILYGQPNDYLRGKLEKVVSKLNRRWTSSTGPG